jgi:hypothetical protein
MVCEALKPLPHAHYPTAFDPDVFPIVELFENFPTWGENRSGEALAIHINPNDVASARGNLFLGEESDDLTVGGQAVGLTCPASFNQIGVSLIVLVFSYRDGGTLLRIQAEFDEEPALGIEGFAVPRHIELDCNCYDCFTFAANNRALNITNYLAVEGGSGFAV